MSSFYEFTAESINNQPIEMKEFEGKVILVVNTASRCGFSEQYLGLEKLYQEHKDKGLVILGFPCNQFGHQEPDNNEEIANACQRNYGVSFPLFSKSDVKGKEALPLFDYLTHALPGMLGKSIKWNFTKFLINRDGQPIKRYAPNCLPEHLESDLVSVLDKNSLKAE